MTLPASGQINTSQIRAEVTGLTTGLLDFGAACPRELAERASGQVGMFNFRGKSITPIASRFLNNYFAASIGSGQQAATLTFTFNTSGNVTIFATGASFASFSFRLCSLASSNFQVQFVPNVPGAIISNGAASYTTINTNRVLALSTGSTSQFNNPIQLSGTVTFNVRRVNNTAVVASKQVNIGLTAEDLNSGGGFDPF
jgi:hypothetical protein